MSLSSEEFLGFGAGEFGAKKKEPSLPASGRRRRTGPKGFRFPLGLSMIEGENYRQREGYEVVYLKDEETPRYQFTIAVGADLVGEVFERLAELLPERTNAVLEVPGACASPDCADELAGACPDDGRDMCEVWMGPVTCRDDLLRHFRAHEHVLVNDGMVGFGVMSPGSQTELFLDEHKLLFFYSPEMERADAVLKDLGIVARDRVRHFSELGHVHTSLMSMSAGVAYWEVAEEFKRTLGLELEETKDYS